MMGQGTQIIFVVAVTDLVNVNFIKSGILELIVLAGFVFFCAWVLLGAYYIYHAQDQVIQWYEWERIANDTGELAKLIS